MIEIAEYSHNDAELIAMLGCYFGSEEHYCEHNKHFSREKAKRYFIASIDNETAGYCSLKHNEIMDVTTLPKFRRLGVASALVAYIQQYTSRLIIGTSNPYIERIATRLGFTHYLNRGKYKYFSWEKK